MQPELERFQAAVEELVRSLDALPAEDLGDVELKLMVRLDIALDRRAAIVARKKFVSWCLKKGF